MNCFAGILSQSDISKVIADHSAFLTEQFKQVETFQPERLNLKGSWSGLKQAPNSVTYWDTGVPKDVLRYIGGQSVQVPEDFVSSQTHSIHASYTNANL